MRRIPQERRIRVKPNAEGSNGHGFDARSGETVDMVKAGIIDPVKVSYCAVRNAGSVAALILTTQTLIAKKPDDYDITAGPARGGAPSSSGAVEAKEGNSAIEVRKPEPRGFSGGGAGVFLSVVDSTKTAC
jgi:hypothetical protein